MGRNMVRGLSQRYSPRGWHLRRSPGFTATALVSLAVGVGANTAIFTIINAVLLKSLPVRDPKSLIVLGPSQASGSGFGIPRDGSFSLSRTISTGSCELQACFPGSALSRVLRKRMSA